MLVYRLNFVIIGEKFLVGCSVQSQCHLPWGSCCHVETSLSPMLPPLGAIMQRHRSLFWARLEPGLWPSCPLCLPNHHLATYDHMLIKCLANHHRCYLWTHAYEMKETDEPSFASHLVASINDKGNGHILLLGLTSPIWTETMTHPRVNCDGIRDRKATGTQWHSTKGMAPSVS